jgi:hypothetical protein
VIDKGKVGGSEATRAPTRSVVLPAASMASLFVTKTMSSYGNGPEKRRTSDCCPLGNSLTVSSAAAFSASVGL